MRRQLPVFVERSIQHMQADRSELADDFQRKALGATLVTCKAGCASCCYHPVLITILEAVPIYGALVARGRWLPSLKATLQKTALLTAGLDIGVWLLSNIACPLLSKENRCTVYDARPFACRVTAAVGDPYYCAPQRLGNQSTIVSRKDILAEFHTRETALLRKHGLLHLTMPIGRAVLLAEKVCAGTLALEDLDRTYLVEHMGEEA
jgi:Fe-S-cluster containining protein